jgi:hypothetical protein
MSADYESSALSFSNYFLYKSRCPERLEYVSRKSSCCSGKVVNSYSGGISIRI